MMVSLTFDYRFPVNDDLYGGVVSVGLGVVLLHGLMISWVGEQFRVADVDGMHYGEGVVVNLLQDATMNLVIGALLLNPSGS